MLKYWKRALRWARQNTSLLTPAKVGTSLGLSVVTLLLQGGTGLRPWDATWRFVLTTIGAYAAVSLVSFAFNAVVKAPVALDSQSQAERAQIKSELDALTPKPVPLPPIEYRQSKLRGFVQAAISPHGKAVFWLSAVVPRDENYDHYVEPLKQWAKAKPHEIRIRDLVSMPDGRTDVQFKAWGIG